MADIPHLAARVFSTPLMIQPQKLKIISQIVQKRMAGENISAENKNNTPQMQIIGNVAIISVVGTLLHRCNGMEAYSGFTSYESLSSQLHAALEMPRVEAILFDIDSGGGECAGCFALVDEIYAARSQKPIWAVANEHCFSAAYAIASAAERVFLSRTGSVGSIGVIATHLDVSEADAMEGEKYTLVFAGAQKADLNQHQPLSDSALIRLQNTVDEHYAIFTSTVARNRSVAESAIRATEAGVFLGAAALTAGLADELATFDEVLSQLRVRGVNQLNIKQNSNPNLLKQQENIMPEPENNPINASVPNSDTAAAIEAAVASATTALRAEADNRITSALSIERQRVLSICSSAQTLNIPFSAISGSIADGVTFEAAKSRMVDYLATNDPLPAVHGSLPEQEAAIDQNLPVEERAKLEWQKNPKLRAEYGKESTYLSFLRAQESGLVRIKDK